MKISWGTGLTIFIIAFLVSTIGVVLYLMTIDVNLVADDYYEQEIKYQQQIDKISRTKKLSKQLIITINSDAIIIKYPTIFEYSSIEGDIHFYRPSSNHFDREFIVQPDSNYLQIIKTDLMAIGMWKVKVDWEVRGTTYFNEEIVMVN